MSHLRKSLIGRNMKRTGLIKSNQQDFAPTKWSEYFDSEDEIETNDGKFHIYRKGNTGPIILCLHGGGYCGLTWALFAVEITATIDCQLLAIDLRGHGNTITNDDTNLSLEVLAKDVLEVVSKIIDENSSIVIVGHSMGGAVAVEVSGSLKNIVGVCIIDVVEGTALDALSSMQSFLRGRPSYFKSVQHAIQWCYKGGQTHNIEAAKVSMPGQIINVKTRKLASNEIDSLELTSVAELSKTYSRESISSQVIYEVGEKSNNCTDCDKPPQSKTPKTEYFPNSPDEAPKYTWRIDLSKTESYWSGWYKGLSQKFLDLRVPKLLFLANIHGLDTTLTVGQMQGKFQLQVLSKSGHAIHEDQPHNVAEIIGGYLVKQKITTAKVELITPMPGC